ncbi:hypothetical protein IAT38_004646 [Cryptococcus sp. DSM 104549]
MSTAIPTPRYDFYQTETQLILALYVKGYAAVGEDVKVTYGDDSVDIILPPLDPSSTPSRISLRPLVGRLAPGSTHRVLGTKIELKLAKAEPTNWPSLLRDPTRPLGPTVTAPARTEGHAQSSSEASSSKQSEPAKPQAQAGKKKNWDKLLDDELDEGESADPNAGGDAALQKFFSKIYGDADEATKRAMIKSYTESGGTSLSTDWSSVGKETTPIRPPEGVEPKKF